MIRFKSTTTAVLSENITKIYQNKIWKIHGVPQTIFSNRRSQFCIEIHEILDKGIRNKNNIIHSISPSNRQSNRINKPKI